MDSIINNFHNKSSDVAIVIVNYKTPELTIDCLKSLASEIQNLSAKSKVIVTDNASNDGSVEKIQTAIENWNWVEFKPLDQNGGYAFGNNAAIRPLLISETPPDYILLLNPDTIVRPDAVVKLIQFMNQHPDVGIAGSRLEDPDGTPQRSAFRFHTIESEIDRGLRLGIVSKLLEKSIVAPPVSDETHQVDWVAGASMIIRKEVFDSIGLLDEDYFMYYEEVDFCLQAKKAGWNCWYVPDSRVVHLVGQSSGVTDTKKPPKRRPQYWFNSRRRYFLKNHGAFYAALADLAWLVSFILWRIRRKIQNKPDCDPPYFVADSWRNSVFVRGISLDTPDAETAKDEKSGLFEQIKEDWIAHKKDWTKPGFRAVAVQRFGVWRMNLEPKLLRAPFSLLYRALYRKVRNTYGIDLPYTVQLGRRVIIEHHSGIIIHGNSVIGDDSIIRQGVTLGNRYLDRPLDAPILGKKVNVGAGAKILGKVIVGDEAKIGANAVVLKDVPSQATVVGIPAKILDSPSSLTKSEEIQTN